MSKPLFVEIKGVQFRNKGAYLMLLACLEGLKRLPDYQLVLSPGPNLPYPERARLGAWQKLAFRRKGLDLTGLIAKLPAAIRRLFKRYGMVTERDVDIVLEASGFAYGDQWPLQFLQNTAKEVKRFKAAGKPFIFMPQAFGPFSSENSKNAMRDIIEHASLIFVRDPVSLSHLQSCVSQLPASVVLTPDFTVGLMPVSNHEVPTIDKPYVALIPNSKVVSKYNHADAEAMRSGYIAAFAAAADKLTLLGYQVVLVNHEGREDAELCAEIAKLSPCGLVQIEDPLAVKAFIGGADLVISSRFHGAVNALSQGVPCIATSWSHKYHAMMSDFAMADFCVEELTADSLCLAIDLLLTSKTELLPQLAERAATLKQRNQQMWQQLHQHLTPGSAR
ncbi:polysaccharide pyruvyl transferase family protein [Arsukibacterium indicum]|uniref:Polysaccharide pyruvyl transferase family protein n=1 Tax=Arsukibacterium indicum TaxID=2848612 RepID=A0ABS6MI83_9GAMM|nr:polysaccharide pyruvyl transferase family protein [Arsukibacterium indicum]MBV2128498.1 polysaccharide pyruvyl transferase family protein [Arsukibacterium indicum]